jgi:predicted nucleotidyltransferase
MFAKTVKIPTEAIAAFCRKWQVVEFALFGSVLRDDFGPTSDVDVVIELGDGAPCRVVSVHIPELIGHLTPLVSLADGGTKTD